MNNFNTFLILITSLFGYTVGVKVSVYYEALCPDSVQFICLQLYPAYRALKNHIQLDFVPYGKATHNFVGDKWKFRCQHGYEECKGNKYQSCAISAGKSQENNLDYVNCVMRSRNPASIQEMEKCAKKFDFNWMNITTCAASDQGDNLLAEHGDKTNAVDPNVSFVPTVIFDDCYDTFLQEQALYNFAAVVCSKIGDVDKPSFCEGKSLPTQGIWGAFF